MKIYVRNAELEKAKEVEKEKEVKSYKKFDEILKARKIPYGTHQHTLTITNKWCLVVDIRCWCYLKLWFLFLSQKTHEKMLNVECLLEMWWKKNMEKSSSARFSCFFNFFLIIKMLIYAKLRIIRHNTLHNFTRSYEYGNSPSRSFWNTLKTAQQQLEFRVSSLFLLSTEKNSRKKSDKNPKSFSCLFLLEREWERVKKKINNHSDCLEL